MDNLINLITSTLVTRLAEIEQQVDFERLTNFPDSGISGEAIILQEEINHLKKVLNDISS